ncbi:immunoglobulin-like domain-containing protein [Clostridioides difficile]|uniref:immunoglobulin-like domain-containing protein n=1 Tax=Clostridioides difficile TaxID=1496 RepID=UPI0010351BCD|nr:immunoglobulin-like domain-containing protein [Clostridioides difficile]
MINKKIISILIAGSIISSNTPINVIADELLKGYKDELIKKLTQSNNVKSNTTNDKIKNNNTLNMGDFTDNNGVLSFPDAEGIINRQTNLVFEFDEENDVKIDYIKNGIKNEAITYDSDVKSRVINIRIENQNELDEVLESLNIKSDGNASFKIKLAGVPNGTLDSNNSGTVANVIDGNLNSHWYSPGTGWWQLLFNEKTELDTVNLTFGRKNGAEIKGLKDGEWITIGEAKEYDIDLYSRDTQSIKVIKGSYDGIRIIPNLSDDNMSRLCEISFDETEAQSFSYIDTPQLTLGEAVIKGSFVTFPNAVTDGFDKLSLKLEYSMPIKTEYEVNGNKINSDEKVIITDVYDRKTINEILKSLKLNTNNQKVKIDVSLIDTQLKKTFPDGTVATGDYYGAGYPANTIDCNINTYWNAPSESGNINFKFPSQTKIDTIKLKVSPSTTVKNQYTITGKKGESSEVIGQTVEIVKGNEMNTVDIPIAKKGDYDEINVSSSLIATGGLGSAWASIHEVILNSNLEEVLASDSVTVDKIESIFNLELGEKNVSDNKITFPHAKGNITGPSSKLVFELSNEDNQDTFVKYRLNGKEIIKNDKSIEIEINSQQELDEVLKSLEITFNEIKGCSLKIFSISADADIKNPSWQIPKNFVASGPGYGNAQPQNVFKGEPGWNAGTYNTSMYLKNINNIYLSAIRYNSKNALIVKGKDSTGTWKNIGSFGANTSNSKFDVIPGYYEELEFYSYGGDWAHIYNLEFFMSDRVNYSNIFIDESRFEIDTFNSDGHGNITFPKSSAHINTNAILNIECKTGYNKNLVTTYNLDGEEKRENKESIAINIENDEQLKEVLNSLKISHDNTANLDISFSLNFPSGKNITKDIKIEMDDSLDMGEIQYSSGIIAFKNSKGKIKDKANLNFSSKTDLEIKYNKNGEEINKSGKNIVIENLTQFELDELLNTLSINYNEYEGCEMSISLLGKPIATTQNYSIPQVQGDLELSLGEYENDGEGNVIFPKANGLLCRAGNLKINFESGFSNDIEIKYKLNNTEYTKKQNNLSIQLSNQEELDEVLKTLKIRCDSNLEYNLNITLSENGYVPINATSDKPEALNGKGWYCGNSGSTATITFNYPLKIGAVSLTKTSGVDNKFRIKGLKNGIWKDVGSFIPSGYDYLSTREIDIQRDYYDKISITYSVANGWGSANVRKIGFLDKVSNSIKIKPSVKLSVSLADNLEKANLKWNSELEAYAYNIYVKKKEDKNWILSKSVTADVNEMEDYEITDSKAPTIPTFEIHKEGLKKGIQLKTEDVGTEYSYYINAINKNGDRIGTSNVENIFVQSDFKEFSYEVSNSPVPASLNTNSTNGFVSFKELVDKNYLHVAASDNFGNISEIKTIPILKLFTDEAPILTVPSDISLRQNSSINILEGISASDEIDGDLTSKITTEITGPTGAIVKNIDTKILGKWTIKYSVEDSKKQVTEHIRTINIIKNIPFKLDTGEVLVTSTFVKFPDAKIITNDSSKEIDGIKIYFSDEFNSSMKIHYELNRVENTTTDRNLDIQGKFTIKEAEELIKSIKIDTDNSTKFKFNIVLDSNNAEKIIYNYQNNHYYKLIDSPGITLEEAKIAAKRQEFLSYNGSLATIDEEYKNILTKDSVWTNDSTGNSNSKGFIVEFGKTNEKLPSPDTVNLFDYESIINIEPFKSKQDILLNALVDKKENKVILDWNDIKGVSYYKVYQKKNEIGDFEAMSSNNYAKSKKVKVLNIYPTSSVKDTFKDWINESGQGLIDIDTVSNSDFNSNPNFYLKNENGKYKYDVIACGFANITTATSLPMESVLAINEAKNNNIGVLLGHHYIGEGIGNFPKFSEEYFMNKYKNTDEICSYEVEINKSHEALNYPNRLGEVGDVLKIPNTHSNYNAFPFEDDIVIKFHNPKRHVYPCNKNYDGYSGEINGKNVSQNAYLSIHENTAQIQTGHSGSVTTDEKNMLANTVFYLAQKLDESYLEDVNGKDINEPTTPVHKLYSSGVKQGLKFDSEDVATKFEYYVEGVSEFGDVAHTSNRETVEIKAGLEGFSYEVSNNPTPSSTLGDTINSIDGFIPAKELASKNYVHIVAIDKAGNKSKVVTLPVLGIFTDYAPVLNIGGNTSISKGTEFDIMKNISAMDDYDGDLTKDINIVIKNPSGAIVDNIDTNILGKWTLEYFVADIKGQESRATKYITVKENFDYLDINLGEPNIERFLATFPNVKVTNNSNELINGIKLYISEGFNDSIVIKYNDRGIEKSVKGQQVILTDKYTTKEVEKLIKSIKIQHDNSTSFKFNVRLQNNSIDDIVYNPEKRSYYQFVEAKRITWKNAKKEAENMEYKGLKGHLAIISSQNDLNIFNSLTSKTVWLGGTDEIVEGDWRDVKGEPLKWTNWAPGEPNNHDVDGEDYLVSLKNSNGLWNDASNSPSPIWTDIEGFIVEFENGKNENVGVSYKYEDSAYVENIVSNKDIVISANANNKENYIDLNWNKYKEASYYVVERKKIGDSKSQYIKVSSNSLKDLNGQDLDAPNMFFSFILNKEMSAKLKFDCDDLESEYEYSVKAYDSDDYEIAYSNTIKTSIKTGLKGYSYIFDKIPDTEVLGDINNTDGDFEFKDVSEDDYLHIVAIDNAGNRTKTKHIKLSDDSHNNAPILTVPGLNQVIEIGEEFDKLKNVSAYDMEDGDITSKITVEGDVNTQIQGVYELKYSVQDSKGLKTNEIVKIHVTGNIKLDIEEYQDKLSLSWNKVENADKYIVYRTDINGFDFKEKCILNTTEFIDTEAKDVSSPVITYLNEVYETEEVKKSRLTSIPEKTTNTSTKLKLVARDLSSTYRYFIEALDVNGNVINSSKIKNGSVTSGLAGFNYVIDSKEDTEASNFVNAKNVEDIDISNSKFKFLHVKAVDKNGNVSKTYHHLIGGKYDTNHIPVLRNVYTARVKEGSYFDPLDNISAYDTEDGDLTSKIEVSGNVDTNTNGQYELNYHVEDSQGNVRDVKRKIIVHGDMEIKVEANSDENNLVISWDENKLGDKVFYEVRKRDKKTNTYKTIGYTENLSFTDENAKDIFGPEVKTVHGSDMDTEELEDEITLDINSLEIGDSEKYQVRTRLKDNNLIIRDMTTEYGNDWGTQGYIVGNVKAYKYKLSNKREDSLKTGILTTSLSPDKIVFKHAGNKYIHFMPIDSFGNEGDVIHYQIGKTDFEEETLTPPIISINGVPVLDRIGTKVINVGDKFNILDGITAKDFRGEDLTEYIKTEGYVNRFEVGEYDLKYSVTDFKGQSTTKDCKVIVQDYKSSLPDKPNKVSGKPEAMLWDEEYITVGDDYGEDRIRRGVKVIDDEDGDLTDKITYETDLDNNTVGSYFITYTVTDSDDNRIRFSRIVHVLEKGEDVPDDNKDIGDWENARWPRIEVRDVYLLLGDDFNAKSGLLYAYDEVDGYLTDKVKSSGTVNTIKEGIYYVSYKVTNSDNRTSIRSAAVLVREGGWNNGGGQLPDPNPDWGENDSDDEHNNHIPNRPDQPEQPDSDTNDDKLPNIDNEENQGVQDDYYIDKDKNKIYPDGTIQTPDDIEIKPNPDGEKPTVDDEGNIIVPPDSEIIFPDGTVIIPENGAIIHPNGKVELNKDEDKNEDKNEKNDYDNEHNNPNNFNNITHPSSNNNHDDSHNDSEENNLDRLDKSSSEISPKTGDRGVIGFIITGFLSAICLFFSNRKRK